MPYGELYQQKELQKQSTKSVYDTYIEQMQGEKDSLYKQYQQARTGAYTTARTSAIGSNEQLADMGLAGNLYGQPKSGYSETSRVYQDVALQNALNSLNQQESAAYQSLYNNMLNAYMQQGAAVNEIESNYLGNVYQQKEQDRANAMNMADQYASQGRRMGERYEQAYNDIHGENAYASLMKEYYPSKYTYHYELDDSDRQLYDKYYEGQQFKSEDMGRDIVSGDVSPEKAAKIVKAGGLLNSYDNNEAFILDLQKSGYFGEKDADKLKAFAKELGVDIENIKPYDVAKEGLASKGFVDEEGKVELDGRKLKFEPSVDPVDTSKLREDVAKISHYPLIIWHNGKEYKTGNASKNLEIMPDLSNSQDGDKLKFRTAIGKWDDYIYYGGMWYRLE